MNFIEILTNGLSVYIVSAVIVLTQVGKPFIQEERFVPLFGFLIGVLLTFIAFGFNVGVVLPAILIGGAGLGWYDLGKKTLFNK